MRIMNKSALPVALILAAALVSACATKNGEKPAPAPSAPAAEQAPAPEAAAAPPAPVVTEQPAPAATVEAPPPQPVVKKHKRKIVRRAEAAPVKKEEPTPPPPPAPAPAPAPAVTQESAPPPAPVQMPARPPVQPVEEQSFLQKYWLWLIAALVIAAAIAWAVKRKD